MSRAATIRLVPPLRAAVLLCWGLAALTVGALGGFPWRVVLAEHNGQPLKASYRLREDDVENPRLVLLRKREGLDRVIAPGRSQLAKLVLLRHWVHGQWKPASEFYYPSWDAVEILDLARRVGNRGFCAQYAIVYLQACQSLGLHARFVDLPGHFVTSVWCDDLNKWVLMDPYTDVHYERRGVPMSGRGLCDAAWGRRPDDIVRVGADGRRTPMRPADFAPFRNISIDVQADQLREPVTYWWRGAVRKLTRQPDYRAYPRIGRDTIVFWHEDLAWKGGAAREVPPGRSWSDNPDDFLYPVNQTLLSYGGGGAAPGSLHVRLRAENASTFRRFEVCTDRIAWTAVPGDRVAWKLAAGLNRIRARVQTAQGWNGPESSLTVFYWPSVADWLRERRDLRASEATAPTARPGMSPPAPPAPAAREPVLALASR